MVMRAVAPRRKTTTALGATLALVSVFAFPVSPATALELPEPPPKETLPEVQTLEVSGDYELTFTREMPQVVISEEWLAKEAAKKAAAEEAARQAAAEEQARQVAEAQAQTFKNVPVGAGAAGLVQAALAQQGVNQDCTDLVQNSLAAIGLTQRRDQGGFDLGTGIWQYDGFGTRVDINNLAPGDILVYGNAGTGTHVAIYIGDGKAVHGGFNGSTVVASKDSAYQALTGAIRVR